MQQCWQRWSAFQIQPPLNIVNTLITIDPSTRQDKDIELGPSFLQLFVFENVLPSSSRLLSTPQLESAPVSPIDTGSQERVPIC